MVLWPIEENYLKAQIMPFDGEFLKKKIWRYLSAILFIWQLFASGGGQSCQKVQPFLLMLGLHLHLCNMLQAVA